MPWGVPLEILYPVHARSRRYYGVISPEGAASILGRYKDDAQKKAKFPQDCRALATSQGIYAHQLLELNVVDQIIHEAGALQGGRFTQEWVWTRPGSPADESHHGRPCCACADGETYNAFPLLAARMKACTHHILWSFDGI